MAARTRDWASGSGCCAKSGKLNIAGFRGIPDFRWHPSTSWSGWCCVVVDLATYAQHACQSVMGHGLLFHFDWV